MTAPQYLTVTEADREVYISFSRPAREDVAAIRVGKWDTTHGMQLVAAHRIAAEESRYHSRKNEETARTATVIRNLVRHSVAIDGKKGDAARESALGWLEERGVNA